MNPLKIAPVRSILRRAIVEALQQAGQEDLDFAVWRSRDEKEARERGEFSSNAPLVLSKRTRRTPGEEATLLQALLSDDWPGIIDEAKGFLNFRMDQTTINNLAAQASREGARFGEGEALAGQRVNIEFVSSDPMGPLPLSSARHAVCGEALCRLLEFQGADVTREFFLNDVPSSSKMRLLGESVGAFYEAQFGRSGNLPEGVLQDDFIKSVAQAIATRDGNQHLLKPETERNLLFAREASQSAMQQQKQTLRDCGVRFDLWTSETALRTEGRVENVVEKLTRAGHTYQRDGALWLRTTTFGDETDRPLLRSNGQPTYLASDIAYHVWKFERGFDGIFNLWTAEHRPYVARTKAALQAVGCDVSKIEIIVSEGARLRLDGEIMTGRDGASLSLDEARAEVELENLRLHLLLADWDLVANIEVEIATRDDESNPSYAVRLAPSRLATMLRALEAQNASVSESSQAELSAEETELARLVALWPDTTENAAQRRAPQLVARWAVDFAGAVRRLLAASRPEQSAGPASPQRIELLRGAQSAISSALKILGIAVTERF